MLKLRSTKLMCLLIAFIWTTVIIGSSYAYFIDSVTVTGNVIAAGNLKAGLEYKDKNGEWQDASDATIFNYQRWEPGYTDVQYIRMSNKGDLALQYELNLVPDLQTALMDVIDVYFGAVETGNSIQDRATFWKQVEDGKLAKVGSMRDLLNNTTNPHGLNGDNTGVLLKGESKTACIVLHMQEEAGNEYQNLSVGEGFKLQMYATQYMHEEDSFGKDYDEGAESKLPELNIPTSMTIQVQPVNGRVPSAVIFKDPVTGVSATVPAGAKMADGAKALSLIVSPMTNSQADIDLDKGEVRTSYNVKIDGLAEDSIVPAIINMGEVLPKGLNMGNYTLYHVENGNTVKMNHVDTPAAHNDFAYNPATGEVTVAMATFSEVTLVSDKEAKWEGNYDYSWYNPNARSADYTIANADQLAAFGAIVGGMNGQTQDSFAGKTVKLLADVNLGDKESENNPDLIFYPIGYYNSEGTYERTNTAITSGFRNFEGTFDGNGHTIANFYHNTWEMKGDNDQYAATLQYYRDGMGLFGKVYGGTVKNLTVDSFSSDGEYTTTGVIAAYADGATFENIAITNCNPRVYNIGNGGIVGCVGWYAKEANLKSTFKNVTVDNSNKISALWGSYDVACGGLVGQYYPTSGQTSAGSPKNAGIDFVNCHVSAIIDVYNDVCGNYQYYAYRYAGMIIGSIRENTTNEDGKTIPDMTGISATGCTVNYGDWNDYYYCEFEKNGHPSYSGPDDYKFSRVPHSELKFTDSNDNRLVDANERASVTGCTHNHTDAEDNKAIYLPFHQLFTGYGWGVNSIGLEKYSGIVTNLDITEGDQEESVQKFTVYDTIPEFKANSEVRIGSLFEAVADLPEKIQINPASVYVSVSALNDSGITGTFVANATNWKDGTLTLHKVEGLAKVTIQDYKFCKPTSFLLKDGQLCDVFAVKFPNVDDYLYRVGNQNAVALGSLFETEIESIGAVSVKVETIAGNVTATYSSKTTWTNSTIQFSGTGVVKVTITDKDYCIPTELYLEVVDATNLTSATGTITGGNFVLLCDVNTSTYVNYWNCTLYGNGFTYSLKGAPTVYNSKQGHGILITQNATLDNLVIVGDIYTGYGAYKDNDYYNTAIDVQGATIIQNCYIANCAAPVKARADVTIKDTTLYGGAVANLIIMSGTATLENVTTANYDDGRTVVGLGIVIHSDATKTAKLVLNGTLTQYNFISESNEPTDDFALELYNVMFGNECTQYHFGQSPNRYVNTGVISMTENFGAENIVDNSSSSYTGQPVTIKQGLSTIKGYVYTQPNTVGSVNNNYDKANDQHKSKVQGDYLPKATFDLGSQAVTGEDTYIKGDINGVEVRYIKGKTPLTLDITKLMTVSKYTGINYAVTAKCKDPNGNEKVGIVTFDTAGSYTLVFTVSDDLFYNEDGTKSDKSVTRPYEVPLSVVIAEPEIADAVITINNTAQGGSYSGLTDKTITFNPLNAITITDTEGKVKLTTNIASTEIAYASSSSAFAGATTITVTYNDGRELKIVLDKPSLNSPGSSKAITYANDGTIKSAAAVKGSSATGGTWKVTSYSFKGTNGKTVTNSTVVTFTFPDKSCVTADTLVTLADGSKKEIQHVTYEDQLLVWNFFTGAFDVAPSSIIFYHGHELFDVMSLKFDDGTTVKTIHNHGFYDVEENRFVIIDEENVASYLGHSFIKVDGEQYKAVKLVDYSVEEEYTGCYSIQTAQHNNFMVEDMFSITKPAYEGWFDYFKIGDDLKYDEAKMQADIEKYGLYTYEEFAEYVTYEQFMAFSGPYLKVLVGRGVVTFEDILNLINTYVK